MLCARANDKTTRRRGPDESLLNEYGVEKVSKTASGREYLKRLREKYKDDLLQPSDPRFKEVYGKKHQELKEMRAAKEEQARREWASSPNAEAWRDKQRRTQLHEI